MRDLEKSMAFIVHLRDEHRKLHQRVREIEKSWPGTGEGTRVIEELEQLRAELARHFIEEEQGGCLEEAVCRCPSLSQEVDQLELEHPSLLDGIQQIIDLAQDSDSVHQAEQDFMEFARRLHAHEAAESRILGQAFGVDPDHFEAT